MAQNKTEPIKTDVVAVVQRNYLEKKIARELKLDLEKRNKNAFKYSFECERKQQRKDKLFAIGTGIVCAGLLFTMVSCYKPTEATPTETNTTPMSCKVVETRGNRVTVECRGEIYSFYGDDFSEGEMITCYFTEDYKIVNATK